MRSTDYIALAVIASIVGWGVVVNFGTASIAFLIAAFAILVAICTAGEEGR